MLLTISYVHLKRTYKTIAHHCMALKIDVIPYKMQLKIVSGRDTNVKDILVIPCLS